ncbi:putative methyltransferase PMT26 [Bienertia sinuspersici]
MSQFEHGRRKPEKRVDVVFWIILLNLAMEYLCSKSPEFNCSTIWAEKPVEEEEGSFVLWLSCILTCAGANIVSWLVLPRNISIDISCRCDNIEAIRKLQRIGHYEHQERHCLDEAPTCLVHLPEGYKLSVKWPKGREKASGECITFLGGGVQFVHNATRYVEFIEKMVAGLLLYTATTLGIDWSIWLSGRDNVPHRNFLAICWAALDY